jgi:hypothetical protein
MALEFSPQQIGTIQSLLEAGFGPIAIPPYENALCMSKGNCAVILAPVPNAGLKILAPPAYLVDGNLGVRLRRPGGEVFVWKKVEVAATEERLKELEAFKIELTEILALPAVQ